MLQTARHTHKFLLDGVSLVGFLQGAVFNVTDGDSPAGPQGDQNHQSSLPGVQHVIVKLSLIRWKSQEVNLKPETHKNTKSESEPARVKLTRPSGSHSHSPGLLALPPPLGEHLHLQGLLVIFKLIEVKLLSPLGIGLNAQVLTGRQIHTFVKCIQ